MGRERWLGAYNLKYQSIMEADQFNSLITMQWASHLEQCVGLFSFLFFFFPPLFLFFLCETYCNARSSQAEYFTKLQLKDHIILQIFNGHPMQSFPLKNKSFYFLSLFFSKLEDNSKQALTFFGSWTSPLMGVHLTKALHVGLAEK